MDNFHIDITYEGDEALRNALEIAFRGSKAEAYAIIPKVGLVFFAYGYERCQGAAKLPFKLDVAGAADFARRWLAEAEYGSEPDHDGSNGKGWRVYTEHWGRIGDWWGSLCAVQPAWAEYGK
jgi:hypothetical protein